MAKKILTNIIDAKLLPLEKALLLHKNLHLKHSQTNNLLNKIKATLLPIKTPKLLNETDSNLYEKSDETVSAPVPSISTRWRQILILASLM